MSLSTPETYYARARQAQKQRLRAAHGGNPFVVVEGLGQDFASIDRLIRNDPAQAKALCEAAGHIYSEHYSIWLGRQHTKAEEDARDAENRRRQDSIIRERKAQA
jgi:hypothetical protein